MRISKTFNLDKSQYELDFVDINVANDTPLFLDPYFLSIRNDRWSTEATRTIRSYFQTVIDLVRAGNIDEARRIFRYLSEPNETCLGVSKGRPRGRGVGPDNADSIFDSILQSRAVETGLVEHLEDCAVLVDNVGKDKVSDMTTNIIKRHLIEYTQAQCHLWEIPMQQDVPSGYFWNHATKRWENEQTEMLIVSGRKILLVPKGVVSYYTAYTDQKYLQHFVLNYLQNEHLRLDTVLVRRVSHKDGSERVFVTKKDVIEHDGPFDKEYLREFTRKHPEVFSDFRQRSSYGVNSLTNDEFDSSDLNAVVTHLVGRLRTVAPGAGSAHDYHKLVAGILELIFYPALIAPNVEREIHKGRKRIDITFDNAAQHGFFELLQSKHDVPCPYIMIECKNYSADPGNPELDQLAGRFSPNRGKFGLLVCRNIAQLDLFLDRCHDHYADDHGIIIPLVDDDLLRLLGEIVESGQSSIEQLLRDRLRDVILR